MIGFGSRLRAWLSSTVCVQIGAGVKIRVNVSVLSR